MILYGINEGVYLCLFEHANSRKHVYEYSCSSVQVFLVADMQLYTLPCQSVGPSVGP